MMGENGNEDDVLLAMQEVFDYIDQECSGREFLLRASYIEIYNEAIKDLLNPENKKLKIHMSPQRGVYVADCTEEILLSREMALDLIQRGEHNRHFGETNVNERSSRSHTIFTLVVESRDKRDSMSGAVNVAKLNLVDLAGSERANQTGAQGSRLKEGGFIYESLLFLRNVIEKLCEGDQGCYLSFRESKLTRILQTSLGGNARTGIICTVAPSSLDETHGTLRFASRAKTIKNKPEVNQVLSDQALLKLHKKEISGLKKELDIVRSESGIASLLREKEQLAQELDQARAKQLEEKEAKIAQLQKLILHCDSKKSSGESKKSKVAPRRQIFAIGQLEDVDDDDYDNCAGVEKKEKFSSRSSLKGEHLISKTHVEPSSPQLADLSEYKQQVADDTLLESNQVLQERVKALHEELKRQDERWTKTLEDWKAKAQSMYFQKLEYELAEKQARREMTALQSKFNADIDELVKKHRAQLQSEKEKADEVLKAKMKENENYTGARVVEAVEVFIKRYEDMMNSMGDEWDREKDLLTTTIDKLEDEKIDTADKIEVLEAEIEGYSQFQEVLQRQNDKLIFQNKALKSEARSKLERMRSELNGLIKENERLQKELAAGRSGQESGEGKVFFRHNTVSAVSEAAACEELRKELDLALDEKRSLERICCLWRSKYDEISLRIDGTSGKG
ncbi:centromere-associated protein E-like [Oscarella lobularis]|uniref:centromere-associated protein E-like n=1 Tax=Oscarella lobularis TaxID=121494 RepID=UPI003313209A